jgi:cytochrome c biogenesis protein CcdA
VGIQNSLIEAVRNFTFLTYIVVFIGAFILSLGSCTIVRIPIVLGYVSGFSSSHKQSALILLGFGGGIILCYTSLGFLLGIIAKFARKSINATPFFYIGLGVFLMLIGLYLLDFLPKYKASLSHCKVSNRKIRNLSFFGAFFSGIAFAFLEAPLCPCCGPVLLVLATSVLSKTNIFNALTIFFTYALGQSSPMLLIGISSVFFKFATKRVHDFEPYIRALAGVVLFYFGIYLIWLA